MRYSILVMATTLTLAGCDQANKAISNSIYQVSPGEVSGSSYIVISPGFRINDHGGLVMVFGYSHCPDRLFNSKTETGCIIIHYHDLTVPVLVRHGNSPHSKTTQEEWSIERQGKFPAEVIRLQRPDNSFVMPFENH